MPDDDHPLLQYSAVRFLSTIGVAPKWIDGLLFFATGAVMFIGACVATIGPITFGNLYCIAAIVPTAVAGWGGYWWSNNFKHKKPFSINSDEAEDELRERIAPEPSWQNPVPRGARQAGPTRPATNAFPTAGAGQVYPAIPVGPVYKALPVVTASAVTSTASRRVPEVSPVGGPVLTAIPVLSTETSCPTCTFCRYYARCLLKPTSDRSARTS